MAAKRIRILFTINNLDTAGMKLVLRDVAMGLDPERFEPMVNVMTKTGSALEQEVSAKFPLLNIRMKPARQPVTGYVKGILLAVQELKKHKIDVAHSFDYASDFSEGLVMKLAGVSWVAEKTNLSYEKNLWRRRLRLAKHIVVLSNAQAKLFPEFSHKLTLIPTGTDIDQYKTTPAHKRSDYGLADDDIALISVAQLVPGKGHRELLQAFKHVEEKVPKLNLLFAGRGHAEYVQDVQQLIDELGLRAKVQYLGSRSDIPALLKMCDGKILATRSSLMEAYGAAIIEAFAAGLPVISTYTGGPEDLITPGLNGWLIKGEGTEPIEEALLDFYNNPGKRKQMGANALQDAIAKYDMDTMIAAYAKVYEQVARK